MNLFKKQTHRHRNQTCGYQRGKKWGINKKQGPTVQHRVLYIQQLVINCNEMKNITYYSVLKGLYIQNYRGGFFKNHFISSNKQNQL